MCAQYSAPPTHRTDSLAHRQSEYPMAQTADSQPPETSHVELEQTTSERLRKLPMQLNIPKILVPDLVRASPNASDVQRLGRCVPAYREDKEERGRGNRMLDGSMDGPVGRGRDTAVCSTKIGCSLISSLQ